MTESSSRQPNLVDPERLLGRGKWCLLGGAGPREKSWRISIKQTGLGGQERQGKGPQAPLGGISVYWAGPTLQLSIPLTS